MKNSIKKLIIMTVGVILMITGGICGENYIYSEYDITPLTEEQLKSAGIDTCHCLMITAHPDDEILWGGGHLSMMKGEFFVVVVTNGRNETRSAEFKKVIEASGNKGMILDYPDKTFGKRDDWSIVRGKIEKDAALLMGYKDWDMIVTHNPDGEYGHIHHVMTNDIVTKAYEKKHSDNTRLLYFGRYYKKSELPNVSLYVMSDEAVKAKEELLKLYESQSGTIGKLCHMDPYENWIRYEDWGKDTQDNYLEKKLIREEEMDKRK